MVEVPFVAIMERGGGEEWFETKDLWCMSFWSDGQKSTVGCELL
jgi:hypothetical protein